MKHNVEQLYVKGCKYNETLEKCSLMRAATWVLMQVSYLKEEISL